MKFSLERLRIRCAESHAIVKQQAIGSLADFKLYKLGSSAKELIKSEIGEELEMLRKAQDEIIAKYQQKFEGVEPSESANNDFRRQIEKDPEAISLSNESKKAWSREVEFEFTPISVKIDDAMSSKFTEKEVYVEEFGFTHRINPYMVFMTFFEEGFLVAE